MTRFYLNLSTSKKKRKLTDPTVTVFHEMYVIKEIKNVYGIIQFLDEIKGEKSLVLTPSLFD